MSELTRKQLNYTIACIHEFASRNQMTQQAAFKYLRRYKGIAFLSEFYDVEHTLSMDDAVEDLTTICRKNGGTIS